MNDPAIYKITYSDKTQHGLILKISKPKVYVSSQNVWLSKTHYI